MVVTDLNSDNIEQFYQLFCQLMKEGYDNFSPALQKHFIEKDYPLKNWYYWMEKDLRKVLLAWEDELLVGFLVGDHSYGGVAFITWLGVVSDYRGKGIGSSLLLHYQEYVEGRHAHLLELYTFPKVKAFYEKHGFKQVGMREQGYYGRKNVIMDKKLADWDEAVLKEI